MVLLMLSCGIDPALDSASDESRVVTDSGPSKQDCSAVQRFYPVALGWPLPPNIADGSLQLPSDPSTSAPNWILRDLTGDGLLDIVLTEDATLPGVGTERWMVYANTGKGFDAAAAGFKLPSGFAELEYRYGRDVSTASPNWALWDAGMVVYEDPGNPAVGNNLWLLYERAANGYAPAPTTWTLPPGYPNMEFRYGYDASSATPDWALRDLTNDGKEDLVITRFDGVEGVGEGRWLVHAGSASGFANSGTTFVLPSFPSGEFHRATDSNGGSVNWDIVDLQDDGEVELVVGYYDIFSDVGNERWLVHKHQGNGFASAFVDWILPAELNGINAVVDRSDDGLNWTLMDLQGDGTRDLVVTYGSSLANVGTTRWAVYRNTGKGFADTPESFLLPNGLPSGAARRTSATGELAFFLSDMDGDGLLDFVVTRDPRDPQVGVTTWQVYRAVCDD